MKLDRPGYPILKMQIRYEPDVVTARQKTRLLSELLDFPLQDQSRLATAVSELARNVFQYVGAGSVEYFFDDKIPQTFYVRVSDQGPGIANIDHVLSGQYVSKTGMGVGLIGSKRLMDIFEVSTASDGTKVTIGKHLDRRSRVIRKEELSAIAEKISNREAGSAFEEIQNQNRDLLKALDELRASREELSDLNRELAETNRGVVALYAELDEKAISLKRANEVKTSFLSNMTHEFRTPLSSLISLTRILLQEIDGPLNEEQRKQVNYIRHSGESLLELVNDLLDLAKVEAGKVSVSSTRFDIEELLSGLRGMFRPLLAEASMELTMTCDEVIGELETDHAKLSQILRNLISNAIKFSEKGTIQITAKALTDGKISIAVTDSGIGIESSHLQTIFDDFSQVPSKLQEGKKGTGLGLPLSRKLAKILGGDLAVESEFNKGSTFTVTVPRKYVGASESVLIESSHVAEPKTFDPDNDGQTKFKILLIDDDEASRYVLKDLLLPEIDAQFCEAADGRKGIAQIERNPPDLVFLDIAMPEMDGFDVIKSIRQGIHGADLPVIVNTAKKLSEDEVTYLSKDVIAILSKERTDHHLAVRDLRRALVKAGFDFKSM